MNQHPILYSVVTPMFNTERILHRVLEPLQRLGAAWEVLVVDDASTDSTATRIHEEFPGVRLLSMPCQGGQARARNHGVRMAKGSLVFFVDGDVVVQPETLQAMASFLETRSELDGVFGCYSVLGFEGERSISRFRNLQHRFVHRRHKGPAETFWTGLGAIRRETFLSSGGFDPVFTGIEDVELGKRISDKGGKFWLDGRFEGQHLKAWCLRSMVMTDIFVRAIPWTFHGLQGRMPKKGLNLSPSESAAPIVLALALAALPLSLSLAQHLASLYLIASSPRYWDFLRAAGLRMGLWSVVYLFVHHLCCIVGGSLGGLKFLHQKFIKKAAEVGYLPHSEQQNDSQAIPERVSV